MFAKMNFLKVPGWRYAVAAFIAMALAAGTVGCGSESGSDTTGESDEGDVDVEISGKADMAGFPSGQYHNEADLFKLIATKDAFLSLNLRPDRTFILETTGIAACTPPEGCDPAVQFSPKKQMGTYKFSGNKYGKYFRLTANGKLLAKYQYKMPVENVLEIREIKSSDWLKLQREPSESQCLSNDDCMPGEQCNGQKFGCTNGPHSILCRIPFGTCEPQPCGGGCEPWEVCNPGTSCPQGAYCIISIPDTCVPKTCNEDVDCGDDGAFCDVFDSCPPNANCILPADDKKGTCKPIPPVVFPVVNGPHCVFSRNPRIGQADWVDDGDWTSAAERALGRA